MAVLDKLSQRATDGAVETDGSSKLWGKGVFAVIGAGTPLDTFESLSFLN